MEVMFENMRFRRKCWGRLDREKVGFLIRLKEPRVWC